MAGRVVYIKHILRSVPIYNLMIFDYTEEGMRRLETLSREFLWGFSAEGKAKTALIAWQNLAGPKLYGGLDLHIQRPG
jgi:hypothetical protein